MSEVRRSTILTGMLGSGKSPLGEWLAAQLEQPFTDTDRMIRQLTGLTPKQIIDNPMRSSSFPYVQRRAIGGYNPSRPAVVATGGSVGTQQDLMERLGKVGDRIFVFVNPDVLDARVPAERKAAAFNPRGLSFIDLYLERIPAYLANADHTLPVTTPEPLEETAARLLELRNSIG